MFSHRSLKIDREEASVIKTSMLTLAFVFTLVAIAPAPAEASWWFNANYSSGRCTGETSGSGPSSCEVPANGRVAYAYEAGGLCVAEVVCQDEQVISCSASDTWGEELAPVCYASAAGGQVLCKSDIGLYSDFCQDEAR
jgi:hypothetical protein